MATMATKSNNPNIIREINTLSKVLPFGIKIDDVFIEIPNKSKISIDTTVK